MWVDLYTPELDLTGHEHVLASRTIGWHQRNHDRDHGLCPEAKHLLAVTIAEEALRLAIRDRCIGIIDSCNHGTDPRLLTRRLRRLADDVDPEGSRRREPVEAVAA